MELIDSPERVGPAAGTPACIVALGAALDEAGVDCCHWKSNAQIARSERGENDLDLLVARSDSRTLTAVLSQTGFARVNQPGPRVPGIESFYAYDAEENRFVHVHVHHRLVLGHDSTKNYRLALEAAYLESSTREGIFNLPSPAFEYVVLVVRLALKYCNLDEIVAKGLRGRGAGPKAAERDELAFLSGRSHRGRVEEILREHLPYVEPSLFHACERAISGEAGIRQRLVAGRRLQIALRAGGRHSRPTDAALRSWRRVASAAARRIRGPVRNTFTSGGVVVAVIGGDGAGKSTALEELDRWLGTTFEVRTLHIGKPAWSRTTYAVRGCLKAIIASLAIVRPFAPRLAQAVADYRPLVWLLCTARDRRCAYVRAQRLAARGVIVLCDRYPDARLSSMETPQIGRLARSRGYGRLWLAIARLEERYHAAIAAPDLLVVLLVDPEIAVARKTTESAESVRSRSREIWNADWDRTAARVVDASRPAAAVAAELKKLVWSTVA